jgi:RNA polymerase sigma factor (sigma-70 family)
VDREPVTHTSTEDIATELVARARAGERDAFDRLHGLYERAIYGFVRVRLADDADAQDVAQDTWVQVWQKLPTYDPARASFVTFVKYWASVLLLRTYDRRDRRRGVEVLVRDLVRHTPDLADEAGVSDILDRVSVQAEPSAEPEQLLAVYGELLRAMLASPSPPHQLLAFGFIKALGWPPRRVAAELSDDQLDQIEAALEQAYRASSQLPDQQQQPSFDPLRQRLRLRFDEAVPDRKTQATYPHLLERVVGDTLLRDYYTGAEPTADLTQWWYAVHRRVQSEVQRRTSGPLFELTAARAARKAAATRIPPTGPDHAGR